MPNQPAGLFVVFEGGEGGGKSTQAALLARRLRRAGWPCTLTRDPGGTPLGRKVERWVKRARGDVPPATELLLFAAARSALTADIIQPALNRGSVVISDRYAASSVAYQGYGRGLDLETVDGVNRLATRFLQPDLVVLLDISPEDGLPRKKGASFDRFQSEDLAFHNRVRQGYLRLAAADPRRWLVLDATLLKKELSASIWRHVSRRLRSSASGGPGSERP